MLRHLHRFGLLIAALGIVAGCSDRVVPVTGTVTRNGQPVANLHINFMPEAGRPSWGYSDQQGQFTLDYDPEHKGAEIGKHKVFVKFRPASPKEEELEAIAGRKKFHADQKAIEAKYGKLETTPLEVEIKSSGQKVLLQLD